MAALAANLPFFNHRLFALIPVNTTADYHKPVWVHLLELIVLYGIVGAVARALESAAGNSFHQGWEFYAVTGCLFLVLAYPGYVLRYLYKRHG